MKNRVSSARTNQSREGNASSQPVAISIEDGQPVSGLLQTTPSPQACYVLAHGAGAGMLHPFLSQVAEGLAERSISTLRYQFPYMERGSGRPDVPKVAQGAVRSAVEHASSLSRDLPLFAGGKSFGGRMTSQAQADKPLPGVRGLIFLGFPLHPPGKPADDRAKHLFEVHIPMLFIQGDRDEFADLHLLQSLIVRLGARAKLKLFRDADHSFHVPARSGLKDFEVRAQMLDAIQDWIQTVISTGPPPGATR
jgi:predicted alpha/beta-hydrolase family hydrolase